MTAVGSKIKLLNLAGKGEDSYDSISMSSSKEMNHAGSIHSHLAIGDNEKRLIQLASKDDLQGMINLLETYPETDVNAINVLGNTAIQFAVQCHNSEMVKYLLQQSRIRLRDSKLFAVREKQKEILSLFLEWENRQKLLGYIELPYESVEFASHMTPLMLACIEHCPEIAYMLIQHGHTISIPEETSESDNEEFGESLELGRERVDMYRALASPTYMALTQDDPISAAFTLSHQADCLADKDPIFKDDYKKLSQECHTFAVDLLEQCRTSEEVWVLLKQSHDEQKMGVSSKGDFPRLKLAAEYKQKEFLTHPNCQKVLRSLWLKSNGDVQRMTFWRKLVYYLPRIVAAPFVYIVYFFSPCLPFFIYWEAPMTKFMGDVVSYVIFLTLLLVSIIRGEERSGIRVPNLYSAVDVLVWFWVSSFLVEEIRTVISKGLKPYLGNRWLILRALMTLLFVTAFFTRLVNVFIAAEEGDDYGDLERHYWPWNDPMLVSEAMYCIATVIAFIRVMYLFTLSELLGPLQMSLSRMMGEILQMFGILFVVIFAFASGLTRLYYYYEGAVRVEETGEVVEQDSAFTSWRSSFETLFWAMFGYGETSYTDVIADNTCGPDNQTVACHDVNTHDFTQGTGSFLYAMYHIVLVLTLLNMLIGLVVNALSSIQRNADQEWKFARSLIWLHYIERKHVLPHPFIGWPSVASIIELVQWCMLKCKQDQDQHAKCSCRRCCFIESEQDEEKQEKLKATYKVILKHLFVRHAHQREVNESYSPPTLKHLHQHRRHLARHWRDMTSQQWDQQLPDDDKVVPGATGQGTSMKSRVSAWSGVTDTELGENII